MSELTSLPPDDIHINESCAQIDFVKYKFTFCGSFMLNRESQEMRLCTPRVYADEGNVETPNRRELKIMSQETKICPELADFSKNGALFLRPV